MSGGLVASTRKGRYFRSPLSVSRCHGQEKYARLAEQSERDSIGLLPRLFLKDSP